MPNFTFDDLISWSDRLPDWQRDALRRVLTTGLADNDIAELAEMAKGLSKPGVPPPDPATLSHVPSAAAAAPPVVLLRLRDITHVNALASGPVDFSPNGLTVLYGDNASGKSGIGRILKKAGRARSPGGRIRPSVYDPDPGQPANATIDFRVGSTDRSFSWMDGAATDNDLARINVFDASCAAVQVEKSNQLTYTPHILKVFQDLAEACRNVGLRLREQKEALERARPARLDGLNLRGDTTAGILVARLSARTTPHEVDTLCTVSEAERARSETLTRALQDNPIRQADFVEARRRRLREVDDVITKLEQSLSDVALQNLDAELSAMSATADAARAARVSFAANSALDGIGTPAWKELWESARRYSEALAYPGQQFPVIRDNALCVLCQQSLGTTTASRLSSFEQFVKDDVQQRADRALGDVQRRRAQIEALHVPQSRRVASETALSGTSAGAALKRYIVIAKLRRRYVLRRIARHTASTPPDLPQRPDFAPIQTSLAEEIQRLRAAAQTDERRLLERELAELNDRIKISPHADLLKGEIKRFAYLEILERARNDCDTGRITRKGGDAAQLVLTARLRSAFATNLSRLGFGAAPVELKLGLGAVGQHPYQLSLIVREDVPPAEVLSEGEKTCVALAGFLAELETTNNGSGIVLDDPVSSLDHRYRLHVARQLVEAAKTRQVVVFTHDIVFLLMLTKYARKGSVPVKELTLRRGGQRQHGIPQDGPPWVAMPTGRRIGVLRQELQFAAAILRGGDRGAYEQKAEWIYERLRQSWERAVEEVLLNEVVVRFGDGVSTQRLRALTDITDADVQCVDTEMSYCSSFVHDEAGAVNAGVPDPPVVEADIKRLDDWVSGVRKRRK